MMEIAIWNNKYLVFPLRLTMLKELRHDILSRFFDFLNCGSSVGKMKNNGVLRKKNTKGLVLKQKGTRMAEDGKD